MILDPQDGKPGLRRETAADVLLRETLSRHMKVFAEVIRSDRKVGQAVAASYIDGLAGTIALTVRGGHGSAAEVTEAVIAKLREAITRDLAYAAGIITVQK